jgi:hypothetical protein
MVGDIFPEPRAASRRTGSAHTGSAGLRAVDSDSCVCGQIQLWRLSKPNTFAREIGENEFNTVVLLKPFPDRLLYGSAPSIRCLLFVGLDADDRPTADANNFSEFRLVQSERGRARRGSSEALGSLGRQLCRSCRPRRTSKYLQVNLTHIEATTTGYVFKYSLRLRWGANHRPRTLQSGRTFGRDPHGPGATRHRIDLVPEMRAASNVPARAPRCSRSDHQPRTWVAFCESAWHDDRRARRLDPARSMTW